MRRAIIVLLVTLLAVTVEAAWWWPFGGKKVFKPRISDLLEPASTMMDSAADYATDGNIGEAVEEYKRVLHELDRIELENPDRADSAEFATVRNKRAIVNAAIDSLLLKQARDNARRVVVSDTRDLEVRYALRTGRPLPEWALTNAPAAEAGGEVAAVSNSVSVAAASAVRSVADAVAELDGELSAEPVLADAEGPQSAAVVSNRLERLKKAMSKLAEKDYAAAQTVVSSLLAENAEDAAALNALAAIEGELGDFAAAEKTLMRAVAADPSGYHAYYNIARLLLKTRPETSRKTALRYYETGRGVGGPVDAELEGKLK